MRRPLAPSTSLTAVSAATTPSSPGLNSATSKLSVGGHNSRPAHSIDSAPLYPTGCCNCFARVPLAPTERYDLWKLDHSEFPARFFGHALWGPDRFVDDVDTPVDDTAHRHQIISHV